jgi:hypothetical protein
MFFSGEQPIRLRYALFAASVGVTRASNEAWATDQIAGVQTQEEATFILHKCAAVVTARQAATPSAVLPI